MRWLLVLSFGCLAAGCHLTNALVYPSAGDGDAENVVARDGVAYAAMSEQGLAVVTVSDGRGEVAATLAPPDPSEAIDDVAAADGYLFTLDAQDGALCSWSLADPMRPKLVSGPFEVPVGPFAGVAAAAGRVVVSGGTSELTVWRYDAGGRLDPTPKSLSVSRGQPDVIISPDGTRAYVSTHFSTTIFGVVAIELDGDAPRIAGRLSLGLAGYTDGGTKPASFPLGAALAGDTLYVAYGGGLAVVDVADASQPRYLTRLDLGFGGVHLALADTRAVVVGAGDEPMLAIIDVARREAPRLVDERTLPARATGVAWSGGHIVVAASTQGVIVLAPDS